jgi:hypothetical protein
LAKLSHGTAGSGDPPQPRGFVAGLGQADERHRPEALEMFIDRLQLRE